MVVKVVSDNPVKTKRVVCSKCAYELEYTGEDIKVTGSDCDIYSIVCPRESCKEKVYVPRWNNGR